VHYASLPPVAQIKPSHTTLITHARIFDGDARSPVREDMDVLIADGRIARIGPHPLNVAAHRTLDASGKTLLPGLIDVHTHIAGTESPPWRTTLHAPERNLSNFLAMGVTTVVDMGSMPSVTRKLRDKLETGEVAGPRLLYAGKQVSVRGSHPAPLFQESLKWPLGAVATALMVDTVSADTDFDALVAEKKDGGSSIVKLMIDRIPLDSPALPLALAKRAADAAHKAGLPVAAHVGSEADFLTALDAGADLIAHTSYRAALSDEAITRFKASGATQVSTLRVFSNIGALAQGRSPVGDNDARLMAPEVRKAYEHIPQADISPLMMAYARRVAEYNEVMFENCRKIRSAGIPIVLGTDSPLMGSSAGASAHAELQLLVERCGFTPAEALAAATGVPGRTIGAWLGLDGLGRIAHGSPADLILVDGDPTRQIRDTARIAAVFSRGKEVERLIP
jgi:imidazolonepropionase-like amidohydrolase